MQTSHQGPEGCSELFIETSYGGAGGASDDEGNSVGDYGGDGKILLVCPVCHLWSQCAPFTFKS